VSGYFRRNAATYDAIYANAAWRPQLAVVERALDAAALHGDCVELGAGTGWWTARYVDRVDHVTLLDAAPEMLDIARSRLGERVTYELADVSDWHPSNTWDCAVACLFMEHVPDAVFPRLLATVHDALTTGGAFFIAEAWLPASDHAHHGGHEHADHEPARHRSAGEYEAALSTAGFTCDIVTAEGAIAVTATRD
jgi:trans-aconitate methyltransferase